jgi:hypothetical protein
LISVIGHSAIISIAFLLVVLKQDNFMHAIEDVRFKVSWKPENIPDDYADKYLLGTDIEVFTNNNSIFFDK